MRQNDVSGLQAFPLVEGDSPVIQHSPAAPVARLRQFLVAALLSLVATFGLPPLAGPALALVEIDLSNANTEPLPIAITEFSGDETAGQITQVIAADLQGSGLFRLIEKAAFIDRAQGSEATPRFEDWRTINAQAVVTGTISKQADGRLKAEFRLWDVFAGQQITGQQFFTSPQNWRRIAHIIADAIYAKLTGESGYFDSRVVFVDESGPKEKRVKRLAIMDQDGANVRVLTRGNDLVVTPRFSPTRQEITYMSFEGGNPSVYLYQIDTGQRELVSNLPNMSFSPRFSPDGLRIAMSLQQGANSNIYVMDLRSRKMTRLTSTGAIDTAPSFSPDGARIAFESDRGGRQQLYVMNADGSNQQRISFGNGNYGTPVWSPRGDLIAFTKQAGGSFSIGVIKPDGSGERILTEGYHNEGPTWSPNGRVIMFFRDAGGEAGGPALYSIDLSGRNERRIGTPGHASDPAWSPLLK